MHCPRAPTQKPSNKQRAPTQEPAMSKVKRVSALVSWPLPVLPSCWFPGFLLRFLSLVPGFRVVSFRGSAVVELFGVQTGADPTTELSAGIHRDLVALGEV